jgi:DNA-damage-inducible protein J
VVAKSSLIQVRVDEELRRDADALFRDLGLDVASAIRLFLRQAVIHEGIPFAITKASGFHNDYNLMVLRESIQQLNRGEGKVRNLEEVDRG